MVKETTEKNLKMLAAVFTIAAILSFSTAAYLNYLQIKKIKKELNLDKP